MNNKQQRPFSWLTLAKKIRSASKASVVQKISAPLGKVRRLVKPDVIELVRLTGLEATSGQTITVNSSLKNQNFFLWKSLLFGNSVVEISSPFKVLLKNLLGNEPVAQCDGDVSVVSLKYSDFSAFADNNWFFIPEWVSGVIALPLPKNCLSQERVKSDIRRIRTSGFDYEVSRDAHVFDEFYHSMYLPYIDKRHGEEAMFDSFAEKRKFSEQFDLLLVKKTDNPDFYLAGIMIIYEAEGPRLWSLGVREGGNYVQEGVIGALYHFSFRYLLEKGFDHVRTGGSRAFLNDGVFRFKRKMSQALIGSNWKGYALGIHVFTPAVKAFLLNTPFIFKHDEGLSGAVFIESVDSISEKQIRRLHKDFFQPGLSYLAVYYFESAEALSEVIIPEDLYGQISFYSANSVLIPGKC